MNISGLNVPIIESSWLYLYTRKLELLKIMSNAEKALLQMR